MKKSSVEGLYDRFDFYVLRVRMCSSVNAEARNTMNARQVERCFVT